MSFTNPTVQQASRLRSLQEGHIFDRLLAGPELEMVVRANPLPPDLIDPIVPGTGMFMLHGQPRSRKSLIALELLVALATGTSPFSDSRFRVAAPVPVAYVTADDSLAEVLKRIRMLQSARGRVGVTSNLLVTRARDFSFDKPSLVDHLIRECNQWGVRCLVFDPLRRMTARADQGPGEFSPVSDSIRKIGLSTRASIGLIHHDVRPGTRNPKRREDLPQLASGGGVFSMVDAPIHIKKLDEFRSEVTPAEYKLTATPDRFRLRFSFPIESGASLGINTGIARGRTSRGELRTRIMSELALGAAASGSALAKRLGARKGGVLEELEALKTEGKVIRTPYGTSFMWSSTRGIDTA